MSPFHLNVRDEATCPDHTTEFSVGTPLPAARPVHANLALGAATSHCTKYPDTIYPVSEGNSTHFSPYFQEVRRAPVLKARTLREFRNSVI